MNPLLEQFLQEARENLKFIESHIEELGSEDGELLNSVFRAAHTLKGGSGIVGFEAIKNITHKAEDLLDNLRSKRIEFKPTMIDALYDAFDEVLNLVDAAEQSGDIVEADKDIESKILDRLFEELGEEKEVEQTFQMPFEIPEDRAIIIEQNLSMFKNLEEKLPFEYEEIGESNLNDKRAYGIYFDVDEKCMIYGNDPIYVLSLIAQDVLGIEFGMKKEASLELLNSDGADDVLILHAEIFAALYGSYIDIEDALYNFLDEISILPLDIKTMLDYEPMAFNSDMDVLKDIYRSLKSALNHTDQNEVKSILSKALELTNSSSKEHLMFKRLSDILHLVEGKDLGRLTEYIDKIAGESIEITEEREEVEEQKVEIEERSEDEIEVAKYILKEQLYQLKNIEEKSEDRVEEISSRVFRFLKEDVDKKANIEEKLASYLEEEQNRDIKKESKDNQKTPQKFEIEERGLESIDRAKKTEPKEVRREPPKEIKKDVIGKVIKIEQESIDHLMSVVGELLVAKNSLPYLAESVTSMDKESTKRAILEKYSFINRLTNQLQDLIMSMRMLPISYVFDRYPKLVREISKKLDKKVKLTQEGGETKLDKNMIEMLADPLIHIIRNSLDHGIETPAQRISQGKDEVGEITMKAYPQSDKVIIEVIDDGKGVDVNRIVSKILEKGLIDVAKIEEMSEDEKVMLITVPGLSTVETISEYSGRGVGMDVVKKSLEEFGGSLEIKSQANIGTQIKLSIPVSLAVTTLLHISMMDNHYGFPMENVSETVKIDIKDITYLHNEPFINLREHVIPLLFIESMLDREKLEDEALSIVVLNIKGNSIAIVVNELLGQLDVVQKPLEGILASHPLISGTALLGNGQIIMILDPYSLLSLHEAIKSKGCAA